MIKQIDQQFLTHICDWFEEHIFGLLPIRIDNSELISEVAERPAEHSVHIAHDVLESEWVNEAMLYFMLYTSKPYHKDFLFNLCKMKIWIICGNELPFFLLFCGNELPFFAFFAVTNCRFLQFCGKEFD